MFTRRNLIIILSILALGTGSILFWQSRQTTSPTSVNQQNEAAPSEPQAPKPSPEAKPVFDKSKYSTNDPSSLWIIANKNRPLPNGFVPSDLIVPSVNLRLSASHEQMKFRDIAHADLKAMFAAAAKDGVTLVFGSGYRSYGLQKQFYDSYVARDGQAAADRYSARPGTSEHQTGLSFDATSTSQACHLEICFEGTPEGKWLSSNAYKFGFVMRYPNGKESVTGYQYEPWHFRYVGTELAAELHKQSLTLEEFFDLI